MTAKHVIGVTGGIATGKSTVMAILSELGADVIDADRVYGDLIQPGLPLWERLRSRFGNDIVADSGQIDRRALGRIVFADPKKLAMLDEMTHRAVIDETIRRKDASRSEVVAIEAIKLIESGLSAICDRVWLVGAIAAVQRARLMERNGLSAAEADVRIAAQSPPAPVPGRYHTAIDNSGSLDWLRVGVQGRWDDLVGGEVAQAHSPILPK